MPQVLEPSAVMLAQERLTVARYVHQQLPTWCVHRFTDVRMDMRRSTNGRAHYYLICRECDRQRRRRN